MREDEVADLLIVGTGRVGLALGWELSRAGWPGSIVYLGRRVSPPNHPVFATGRATYAGTVRTCQATLPATVIAVPDAAIEAVAEALAFGAEVGGPVLHTSGVLGSEALGPLGRRGCPVGSIHPLVSVADPLRDAEKLRGAWFGVEGDPTALTLARAIVHRLEGRFLEVAGRSKSVYHAAAVFASNYVVVLLEVAERLMQVAEVPAGEARAALTALAGGTIANIGASDPRRALTGPIARGDAATVELHLGQLSARDRSLYSVLAREALALAQARGLPAEATARLTSLLEGDAP